MIETLIQQYLSPVVLWFVGMFTPAEWKAFVLLIAVTMAVTHIVKFGWRILPIPAVSLTYRHSVLYLIACAVSFISAPFLWPPDFSWWIPGIVGGPASAIVFKLGFSLARRFTPNAAARFNADRRKRDAGPPGGFARRSTDEEEA